MIFSSLEFVSVFLPCVFLLYLLVPSLRVRNGILLLASLLFYAYGEPVYVVLMLASSALNYGCARCVASTERKWRKCWLVIGIVLNLGILCVFKYANFVVDIFNELFSTNIPLPQIALPVGISFFTFQALSYVIDVYSGKVDVQKNYGKVLLYISFFPQLIAGPIVKYRDIAKMIDSRVLDAREVAEGFRRFIIGLGKKVLIADTVAYTADVIFASDVAHLHMICAWVGAVAYMLQIYFDFSGYSDMAIGLGHMFGFTFKENFNHPYGAENIQDFWRKWHISLSGWFKEYLYIPLGGNRKGKVRTVCNRLLVFLCTGLWHGANWTFVIWGLYHGLFLLLEEYVPVLRKLPKALGHLYTSVVVCVGFVIFRSENLGQAYAMIRQMFCGFTMDAASASLLQQVMTPAFVVMCIAGIIGAAPAGLLLRRIKKGIADNEGSESPAVRWMVLETVSFVLVIVLLAWCLIRMSGSTYSPFIYFRF